MNEAKGDSTGYVMRFSHLKGWHNPSNILRFEKQSHEGLSYRMRSEAFMAFFLVRRYAIWTRPLSNQGRDRYETRGRLE